MGLVLLILQPRRVRAPAAVWPLLALLVWTLLATAFSQDPSAALPQIKKFFVFAMLPLVHTAFDEPARCRRLTEAWFIMGLMACIAALVQFVASASTASRQGVDFYSLYVDDRITGFHGHWMTFSQVLVLVLLTLACYLFFARRQPGFRIWIATGVVMVTVLLMSFTRSAWLALLLGGIYLLTVSKSKALLVIPVLAFAGYFLAPASIQQRVRSIQPAANQSRIIMWRTGLNMIKAHPWMGLGPEQAGVRFQEFQPVDVDELPQGFYGHLHNVYIHFAAERGVPAALIVVWLFAQILLDLRRGLRSVPDVRDHQRFLLHAGIVGTLAVALLSIFDVSLGDSEILAAYLALIAIAYQGIPVEQTEIA